MDITSVDEFKKLTSGTAVVDFHAQWCGPCKAIAPFFDQLAKKNPKIKFGRCDVDAARDVAQMRGITAMPTFQFFQSVFKPKQNTFFFSKFHLYKKKENNKKEQ